MIHINYNKTPKDKKIPNSQGCELFGIFLMKKLNDTIYKNKKQSFVHVKIAIKYIAPLLSNKYFKHFQHKHNNEAEVSD